MWRRNTFEGNQDSDQSISEDEDLNVNWSENCVSLGEHAKEKGIQILSKFEVLRDAQKLDDACTPNLFHKRQTAFCIEDDVEIPIFENEDNAGCSPRMAFLHKSDEKEIHNSSFQSTNSGCGGSWSAAAKEAEALFRLNENPGCSSSHAVSAKVNRSSRGGQGNNKPKFSFHFQPKKENLVCASNSEDETEMSLKFLPLPATLESGEDLNMDYSKAETVEVYEGGKIEFTKAHTLPSELTFCQGCPENSMADLLEGLQEKSIPLRGNSYMYSRTNGRRSYLIAKRSKCSLGVRNIDDHDPLEALASGTSSEEEAFSGELGGPQNLKLIVSKSKQKTMADQFQEVFGAAFMKERESDFTLAGQSGIGLFAKLQQVMLSEKERDVDFSDRQRAGHPHDKASCINVRILSRSLEGKLIVCCCSYGTHEERYQWTDNPKLIKEDKLRTSTIIFNSRVCSDVELEVGSLIRIHPPWKEVHVTGIDEAVILSTYFSQISV